MPSRHVGTAPEPDSLAARALSERRSRPASASLVRVAVPCRCQAGIYALSASQHFIGNRVSGHENALYVNHQGNRIWGIGAAAGRTCIMSNPFLTNRGNVLHNNVGFGCALPPTPPRAGLLRACARVPPQLSAPSRRPAGAQGM